SRHWHSIGYHRMSVRFLHGPSVFVPFVVIREISVFSPNPADHHRTLIFPLTSAAASPEGQRVASSLPPCILKFKASGYAASPLRCSDCLRAFREENLIFLCSLRSVVSDDQKTPV